MSNVVISFLGAGRYRDNVYNFRGFEVKARYASTAFISYIRGKRHTRVDSLVICGTQSSTWNLLSEYFSEMSESMFGSESQYAKAAEYLGAEDVTKANEAMLFFQRSQNLGEKKQEICAHEEFNSLLKDLQDSLNKALEPVSFKVTLLEHSEIMGEYSQQTALLNRIRELDFINDDTQIYLDITNGMRIIPFAVFANFQCLCQLRNLNIKEICYMPESMPKTEPLVRLDAIENIKSRLRYLREHDLQSYNSKYALIKGIMKTEAPKSGQMRPVEVCFLDGVIGILDNASMIAKFNVTADPSCFADAVRDKKQLRRISYSLNMGRYSLAADLIRENFSNIRQGIENVQIKNILTDFFAWAYEMKSGDRDRFAKGIKSLSSSYLAAQNYVQAINSCYSSIVNYEFRQEEHSGAGTDSKKQEMCDAISKRYPGKGKGIFLRERPWDRLMYYRGMLIHKNDITDDGSKWIRETNKILMNLVYCDRNESSVSLSKLPDDIRDCMVELGVKSREFRESTPENVLISFIGSGDYAKCNYAYVEPDGSSGENYNLNGSRVIGMSLAKKISSFSGSRKLTKLLICGTKTSNWRIVLYALQQEFGSRLRDEAQDELDVLIKNIEDNQDYVSDDASVSYELVSWLNSFMSANSADLGVEMKALMTDDRISGLAVEQELFDMIDGAIGYHSSVSFDITHCYRIIPILVLCIIEYLVTVKKVRVEHIFYGEIPLEPDFNILNGLKKAQLEDDVAFVDKLEQIDKILSDDRDETVLSGSVYDMRNISRQFDYSFMLGQYRATDNPAFLDAIMSSEYGNKDSRIYESFKNGVFLNNFLMLRGSSYFLVDVIIALHMPVQDPVLSVLKSELIECLNSRLPLDDNYEFSSDLKIQVSFMCRMARSAVEQRNYAEALCFCYEAMMYLPEYLYEKMRKFGKKSYEIYANKSKISFSSDLPADVYSFLKPLENASGIAQFIKVFTKHGFKALRDDIMHCNGALSNLLYESKQEIMKVKKWRNNIFHGDDGIKCESARGDDEKFVRHSIENALDTLEHWFDGL